MKYYFDKVFSAKCNSHFQDFQYLCILVNLPLSTFIYYLPNSWKHPWLSKDINSRFVNRNPIHNMLNNLASSFQSSIMRTNEEIDVQSRKRQKTDVHPAFLLNFCCPRSSYDLHFEPTKTIVEFKVTHFYDYAFEFLVCSTLHLCFFRNMMLLVSSLNNLQCYIWLFNLPLLPTSRIGKPSCFSLNKLSQTTGRRMHCNHQKVRQWDLSVPCLWLCE